MAGARTDHAGERKKKGEKGRCALPAPDSTLGKGRDFVFSGGIEFEGGREL